MNKKPNRDKDGDDLLRDVVQEELARFATAGIARYVGGILKSMRIKVVITFITDKKVEGIFEKEMEEEGLIFVCTGQFHIGVRTAKVWPAGAIIYDIGQIMFTRWMKLIGHDAEQTYFPKNWQAQLGMIDFVICELDGLTAWLSITGARYTWMMNWCPA